MRSIEIYTDGGSRPSNPGHGAWAFVAVHKNQIIHEQCEYGGETTNNIMELTAAIKALEWAIENGYQDDLIYVMVDSQYVQQGINNWVDKWEKRAWKTGNRKPVANQELWVKLKELKDKLNVNFQWVRSHSGIPHNDKVDKMCSDIIEDKLKSLAEEPVIEDKNNIDDKN